MAAQMTDVWTGEQSQTFPPMIPAACFVCLVPKSLAGESSMSGQGNMPIEVPMCGSHFGQRRHTESPKPPAGRLSKME